MGESRMLCVLNVIFQILLDVQINWPRYSSFFLKFSDFAKMHFSWVFRKWVGTKAVTFFKVSFHTYMKQLISKKMLFLLNDHNLNEYNEYAVKKKDRGITKTNS